MNVVDLTESRSTQKRKREEDKETTSSPKYPLLDSICHRFQKNHAQRQSKRRREDDKETTSSPKHPLLDSICHRFQLNQAQRQSKVKELETKRETELAHSSYIKKNVADPTELRRANEAVKYWVKRNGVKDVPILGSGSTNHHAQSLLSSRLNNQSQQRSRSSNCNSRYESHTRERDKNDQRSGNVNKNSMDKNTQKDEKKNSRSSLDPSPNKYWDLTDSDDENSLSLTSSKNEKLVTKQSQHGAESSNRTPRNESYRRERDKNDQRNGNVNKNSSNKNTVKDDTKNSQSSLDSSPTYLDLEESIEEYSLPLTSLNNKKVIINIADNSINDSVVEILDLSNNSSPQQSSSNSERQKKYVTRQTQKHVCMVLNCEAVFSSEGALGQHRNLFQHSPCNPYLKEIDCKLLPDPRCFMCPQCDLEFEMADKCRQHMKDAGHMTFYPPLSISCYMCAHCLYVFANYQTCWEHIEESRHKDICYPFIDDERSGGGGGIGPVPVVEEFIQDFIRKCQKVPYRLQCLECSLDLNCAAKLRHHYLETNNQHIVSVLADTNLVDVLAEYLAGYSCDMCHRLFTGGMKELAKHQCADGVLGTIIENNTKSFTEFIKRCALTVIKSEERSEAPKFCPKAGSSKEKPVSTPRKRHKKVSAFDVNESLITISDDEHELTEGLSAGVAISSKSGCERDSSANIGNKNNKYPNKKIMKSTKESEFQEKDTQNKDCHTATESQRKKTKWDQTDRTVKEKSKNTILDQSEIFQNEMPNSGNISVGNTNSCQGASHSLPKVLYDQHHKHQTSDSQSTRSPLKSILDIPFPPHQPTPMNRNLPGVSGSNQQMSHTGNPQNFYCHPPAQQTTPMLANMPFRQPLSGNMRYSLRNQNRNEGSNSAPRPFQGIRIGTASTSSPQEVFGPDKQVAGPSHIAYTQNKTNDGPSLKRDRSRSPVIGENSLISVENLMTKTNIIFLDLDNWPGFFTKLPRVLPENTFVWGFFGGRNVWREPFRCYIFKEMKQKRQFYLNEQCGFTKDAADFAIVLTVGKMDVLLPTQVSFTILSGDKGFCEVERQMKLSKRKAVVINPHQAEKFSTEMVYTMVTSVTDT